MKHKLIHTPDYLLVVDDSEIKFKDRYFNEEDGIGLWQDAIPAYHKLNSKKIIAHLPLNGSPILEGVDLLPPFGQEDEVEELAKTQWGNVHRTGVLGYIDGYNKAKEKYKYTEDDIRKAIRYGFDVGFCSNSSNKTKNDLQSEETFIQSLSQPKMPVGFECEIEYFYMASKMFYQDADWVKCNKNQYESIREEIPTCPLKKVHKEISTPEGHTQWVGKYIY